MVIGYTLSQRGYQYLEKVIGKTHISRHMVFVEQMIPFLFMAQEKSISH